jgi:uncharacterized protein
LKSFKNIISIVVLTTWDCTLNCIYCYARATQKGDYNLNQERLLDLITNCSDGYDSVEFCWHGGEPLLAGKEFYKSVIEIQKSITNDKKIRFKNVIQTNGTLIDMEYLEFFKKHDFSLGLSLDAPYGMQLVQRPTTIQEMNMDDWINIAHLIKDIKGTLGCLCVITKSNVNQAKEIFDFFRDIGAGTYSLLPLKKMPNLECPLPPSNEELAKLYCNTFELWMTQPNKFVSIEPLETMIRGLLGGRPLLCSFTATCLKRMITIDPRGNVIPCAALVEDNFLLGNIFEDKLVKIMSGESVKKFREIRDGSIKRFCSDCDYIAICRGGCRNTTFWNSGDYIARYSYCQSRKETFDYLRIRLKEILTPI